MAETPSHLEKKLLFQMKRIRHYEEEVAKRYTNQKMRCPTHLSVGQEAVPAAISCTLTKEDLAVSTHRGHAHYLGKGGSGPRMIAEIYGKATGCSRGKGGSMHLIDLSCGFKGSTAIVGNTIPIGVGLGLALKLDKKKHLSCIFLGDGAIEEGAFYEAANFAAVHNLPVLFVCENNLYSVYSGLEVRQPKGRKIYDLANAIGLKSSSCDGNDIMKTYEQLKVSAAEVRSGEGPQFLEFSTYRWREHCGPNYDNHIGYRTEEEFQAWKEKDPIQLFETNLIENKTLSSVEISEMQKEIEQEVDEAFSFAEDSPFPEQSEAFKDLYKVRGSSCHR